MADVQRGEDFWEHEFFPWPGALADAVCAFGRGGGYARVRQASVILYLDHDRKEAAHLAAYTIGWIFVFTVALGVILAIAGQNV